MNGGDAQQAFVGLERAYFEMEAFLEQEREHLLGADWSALAEDLRRRQELTAQLTGAEEQRQALGKACGLGPDAPWGEILGGGWEERRDALRECARRVRTLNEENTRLLQEAFDRNERLIACLTDNAGEPAYGSRGEEVSTANTGFLSRKV